MISSKADLMERIEELEDLLRDVADSLEDIKEKIEDVISVDNDDWKEEEEEDE